MSTYMKFPEAKQSKEDTTDSPNSPQSKLHCFKFVLVQFVFIFRMVLFIVLGLVIVVSLVQRLGGLTNPKKQNRKVGNYGAI